MDNKKKLTPIRIFIASPGDLAEERVRFRQAIDEVNRVKALPLGVQLIPMGWEDALPRKGRPQGLINADVESCDLFVLLLWKRWGTPSGEYGSGTEEEFELARRTSDTGNGKPEIWLYFKKVPDEMLADPGSQLGQVLAFRRKIESERAFLFRTYESVESWEQEFRQHLALWLDRLPPFIIPPESIELPTEFEDRLRKLESEIERRAQEEGSAQAKLDYKAAMLGKRAIKAAKRGRLTEAETLFASSLELKDNPDIAFAYGLFLGQIHPTSQRPERYENIFKEIGTELRGTGASQSNAAELLSAVIEGGDVRSVIDTLTTKVVLILGRFTPERKVVLDALRAELRERGYLPVLFDFEKPSSLDMTETISTLAHLSRFIIADITDARSIPQVLARIVPQLPSVPVQPMLQGSAEEYGLFGDFNFYPWVLETFRYSTPADAVIAIRETVIERAEAKVSVLRDRIR